ncbi:MFS transporter [Haloimpatiens sp. FM7330]|uniref:MFS transporter n=1 Tax=Haloimpatiens sp. FM7330 TaxID=3298610 RepID=UPI00363B19D2
MSEEVKRHKHNSWMFILAYVFMGILGGVALDTMVTFLDASEATKGIAASMAIIMGVGFYGGAALLLVIPKLGYKKVMAFGPISIVIGLLLITKVQSVALVAIAASIVMIGVCMFDAVLSPFLSCYTTEEERPKVFSTTIWTNIAGMVVGTYVGGKIISTRFATRLGIGYGEAKTLTEKVADFNPTQLAAYVGAHKDALLIFAVVAALALIPILMVKEDAKDYKVVKKEKKEKINWSAFFNKYIILYVVFIFLIRFGASLITPYYSVFLSRMGIDRSTTSTLISSQHFAIVLFVFASPWIVKKFGRVISLGGLALMSIPFMLLIANGSAFGSHMVMAVGLGLFLRAGFMNAAQPVQQSLPMEFVSKEARPAYNSVIYVAQGLAQVVAGILGKQFIFSKPGGYGTAYYVTGVIYAIAAIMLLVIFTKKYNRLSSDDKKEQAA